MPERVRPTYTKECLTPNVISNNGGSIVKNDDGSVSVYMPDSISGVLKPSILTKPCCSTLDKSYIFDINTQKCMWTNIKPTNCSIDEAFKLILNPKGNDGSLFYVETNENCSLKIDFDYLFKVKCETLLDIQNSKDGESNVDAKVNFELINAQLQLSEQISKCEEISNMVSLVQIELSQTAYSIICEQAAKKPTNSDVSQSVVTPFTKTGFGDLSQTRRIPSVGETSQTSSSSVLYCLTEPEGLQQWEQILGQNNYQNFLNGDATSYNCDDVNKLVDLNSAIEENNILSATQQPILLYPCDIAFGSKTEVLNQLNQLLLDQKACNDKIDALNLIISNLQSTLTTTTNSCTSAIDFFETFDVSMTIDVITSGNTLQTVFEYPLFPAIGYGNLYTYLSGHSNSGFYVCGDPNSNETTFSACTPLTLNTDLGEQTNLFSCGSIMNNIIEDLFTESGLSGNSNNQAIFTSNIKPNAFASQWLHYSAIITDKTILDLIYNKKITLSFKINNVCSNFCVLVDNIVLNKSCERVDSNNIFLTQSPGFNLTKVRDNKKSWIANSTPTNRPFVISDNTGNNGIRQTNYDVNDERLVINTKEIDLDINIASAIEIDLWGYVIDNPCILTGTTNCNPCLTSCCGDNKIDFTDLLTQPLSAITTVEDFEYFMTSELIDAKNRQTISGYPTLRALYDRYLNSGLYCGTNSSAFKYVDIEQFANLVGNYWVDIIEQVVPSTTIWGSVRVYTNTIFDEQKFKYKAYSSLFCDNPYIGSKVPSPINGTSGFCANVDVSLTSLNIPTSTGITVTNKTITKCDTICLAQMNHGSEFIGKVTITELGVEIVKK